MGDKNEQGDHNKSEENESFATHFWLTGTDSEEVVVGEENFHLRTAKLLRGSTDLYLVVRPSLFKGMWNNNELQKTFTTLIWVSCERRDRRIMS